MKKTVIALAIAALAAAGTSSAATVYNQDGTKVDLSGSFRIFLGKVGENQRGDLINDGSRIKVNASHALDNGLSAFVGYETRFNGAQKSNQASDTGFGNITTKKLFVSILILLDSILLLKNNGGSFNVSTRFQSLFYWILFFYIQTYEERRVDIRCFNPYSTGFYSFIRSTEQTLYF